MAEVPVLKICRIRDIFLEVLIKKSDPPSVYQNNPAFGTEYPATQLTPYEFRSLSRIPAAVMGYNKMHGNGL